MKLKIQWIVANGIYGGLIYLAIFKSVIGAERMAIFITYFLVFLSLCLLSEAGQKELKKQGRPIPKLVDVTYDLLVCSVWVWAGYYITGTAYLIHFLLYSAAYEMAERGVDNG